ncbi:fibroblast growth factor 21 [Mauremys mutica]|uniref:fibroblast growth factor 21 n=1 Tax=Mauremys reevesii TaxID=260615 RepID=UPI00193F50B8|nr:fibroblast growth factor 21 [Mauremys reevesii]XP_044844792.1 fibroblast growth factor 21 [Mauremys mutica]
MWGGSTPVPAESWLLLAALMWGTRPPAPSQAAPLQNSSPLYQFDGQVRLRHLYTANAHTQLYLEITPQGEVRGAPDQTPYSLMEIKAVKPGVIRMQAMKTLLFLCMDPSGHLHGASSYSEEACNFREKVQRDGYNLYFSESHKVPVSLRPAEGPPGRGRPAPRLFHFLPMVSRVPVEPVLLEYDFYGDPPLDVESSDPLSMMGRLSRVLSPSYIF